MTAAIFGLAGVIIGGLLTGGISYVLESRRERKAAQVAARILMDDFAMARARVETISARDAWPQNPRAVFRFSTEVWVEQRQILAAAIISTSDYFDVADAAHGIDVAATMVNAAVPTEPITNKEKAALAEVGDRVTSAQNVLRPHAGK
jgi:hypothetical protein